MNNDQIKVSVICLAYNHEKYIHRTLEGFVNQKTDFAYEVWVHDDCSTDGTAAIIRDYVNKYPEIIKPILQAENQYSKGVKIIEDIIMPRAKGRYVAFCEGDDYWVDPNKLQKQYDFLSKNPDYSACVHKTVFHNVTTGEERLVPEIKQDRDFSLEEITMVGGGIFGTNSIMMWREIISDMPECFLAHGFCDYQMFMHAAMEGKVHCLDAAMSVYNVGVDGSWTQRIWENKQLRIQHYQECIELLKRVDVYYNRKYHHVMQKKLTELNYQILKIQEDWKGMRRPEYRLFYICDVKASVKAKLIATCPWLVKLKDRIKGR